MDRETTFCEKCRKDIAYTAETASLKGTLKTEEYCYTGQKAICAECGSEVYAANVADRNLEALNDAYRRENGIISLEQILEIPQKYDIGKRPLSLLLGWGELTFSRYCDGYMPTKQYSEILKKIYSEPVYYLTLLEGGRENLKSQAAYEKSRKAAERLRDGQISHTRKIDEVISYLLFRCEDVTPLALQKALYYIQGFYYAFAGSFMFADDCEAWVHGLVYRDIYNRYSGYKFDPIKSDGEFDVSVFTDAEKTVVDSVVRNLCCYSGKILEQFTHSEMPWLKTRGDLPARLNSDRIVSKEVIGEYFSEVKRKYNMLSPGDIGSYARDMFEKLPAL